MVNACQGDVLCSALVGGAGMLVISLFVAAIAFSKYLYRWFFRKRIATRERRLECGNAGFLAFQNNSSLNDNPYLPYTDDNEHWKRGFLQAERKRKQVAV